MLSFSDREKLIEIGRHYGVLFLGVFGSYARGSETASSDLDVLVRFRHGRSLLEMVRIEREMSEAIGKKVDLLTEESISPFLRDRITDETVVLYEQEAG